MSKIDPKKDAGRPTLLVVEDDDTNRMIITKIIEDAGYQVVQAVTGMEALKVLSENYVVKVVLLDWMLPEMDGIDVLKKIRGSKRFASLPVIMQTGNDSAAEVKQAVDAGADDYIVKPIDPKVLMSKVQKALQGRRTVTKAANKAG
jgi:CheY-like chemotaxis protein